MGSEISVPETVDSENNDAENSAVVNAEPLKEKLFLPIGLKLITMISLIVIISLLAVALVASYFFRADNKTRAMEDTLNYSSLISKKVNTDLSSVVEKARIAAISLHGSGMTDQHGDQAFTELMFSRDPDMIFIGLLEKGKIDSIKFMGNEKFFQGRGRVPDFRAVIKSEYETVSRSFYREEVLFNPSIHFSEPVIGLSIPYDMYSGSSIIVVFYSMNRILESIGTSSIISSFIVSGNGDIIAHRDRDLVRSKTNFSSMPVIRMMMTNPNPNAQTVYKDENGDRFLGAFSRVGFSDAAVVSYVKEDVAFAMVYKIQRIIIWLTGIVLSLSFIINLFFSRSLSGPIKKLTEASRSIQEGRYDLDISSSSRDEIGILTDSFRNMAHGLAEREKIKDAFGKFVNRQIAELVINNEVKLGGERKDVAVFFSDIRSFTEISDSMEPEDVVEFLNAYMTRMVRCVNRTHGVVDKYIGDAIMAVWGAPIPTGDDAFNAVNTAVMMREELIEFNSERGGAKQPVIRIGCGIHCGPVLAGQIGSEERMEYTVIGDTVNIASRIEALNKAFYTDILISEKTAELVRDRFRLHPMKKITVKGKKEPLQIYAVLGRLANHDAPKNMDELRKLIGTYELFRKYGIKKTVPGKEVKYEVLD